MAKAEADVRGNNAIGNENRNHSIGRGKIIHSFRSHSKEPRPSGRGFLEEV
jgi:hypothetical protein